MRSHTLFVALALLCLPLTAPAQKSRRPQSRSGLIERTKRSVVTVTSDKGVLSGFFVGDSQTVLTSAHGVYDATELSVKDAKGKAWVPQTVAIDGAADLALLRLSKSTSNPSLKLQPANVVVRSGDTIYVVGNPLGYLESTVTDGIVSGSRTMRGVSYLQITAPISHGSSGSPVINDQGYVVGLVKGAIEEGQALNFAVAARQLRSFTYKPEWMKIETLFSLNRSIEDKEAKDVENEAAGVARIIIVASMAKTMYDLRVAESYQFNFDLEKPSMRGWEDTSRLQRAIKKAQKELGELEAMEELKEDFPEQNWRDDKVNDLLQSAEKAIDAVSQTPKELALMEEAAGKGEDSEAKDKFQHNWDLVSEDLERLHTLLFAAIRRNCERELLDAIAKSKVGKYFRLLFAAPGTETVEHPFLPDLDLGELVVRLPFNSGEWRSELRPQDTVVAVDGVPVETLYDLALQLASKKPSYKLKITRDGENFEIELYHKPRGAANLPDGGV